MGDFTYAKSFRDLVVYRKARELQRQVYQMTLSFPPEERFALTDQVRRSSRSIGANIAEAWAKRRYDKHFLSKLTDADGEQFETQHWIATAMECKYLDVNQARELVDKCMEIGRLLGGMIEKADLFCGEPYKPIHESLAEYVARSPEDSEC
jgi:four helix bundle protein